MILFNENIPNIFCHDLFVKCVIHSKLDGARYNDNSNGISKHDGEVMNSLKNNPNKDIYHSIRVVSQIVPFHNIFPLAVSRSNTAN